MKQGRCKHMAWPEIVAVIGCGEGLKPLKLDI